ncbi:MAG TPA: uracil-DNA glycosylase family protein [Candidatus Binataceae bacterium]|nr:uracil-DNA glycosylase family protein [Candidatus Binataceae bacterium]
MSEAASDRSPSEADRNLQRWWRATIRCRECRTIAPWRKFPAQNRGTPRFGLMILGEAPGRVSLDNGRGFSNPRNLTIRRAFARAVAPRQLELEELFYITDTVKCWPASPSGANRAPRASEVQRCTSRHLGSELGIIRPRLILAFGARATHAALGYPVKLSLAHGTARRSVTGIRVIPLMHPSTANIAGMRQAGISSLSDYERRLARLMRSELRRLLPGDSR